MRIRIFTASIVLLTIVCGFPAFAAEAGESAPPKLVLQITVDQLRGDMLARYAGRFGPGGFRRLMEEGTWYANAHYGTSNTVTCAGHAVVVTGADTAEHGIAGNVWFDRKLGKSRYCASDPQVTILGEPAREGAGMSPVSLTATTLGDELVDASAAESRAFAVSGKDRSAIMPGGHLGKAFWFSERTGGFVTSTYYYDALPAWLVRWNASRRIDDFRERRWDLARDAASYRFAARAANEHARPAKSLGRTFPHSPRTAVDRDFYDMIRFTPMLDELTAEFARALMTAERIGQGRATDYLSISFSSTDYIGHAFGPDSVEYEDNLIRLDAVLASLFTFVDGQLGRDRTIIVLSADHGSDDVPEVRREHHFDAGRLQSGKLIREGASAFLKSTFGVEGLLAAYEPPGLYLSEQSVAAAKLDRRAVEEALADFARTIPGVAYVFTRSALMAGEVPPTALGRRVARGFHPARSGDVILIQKQFWYMDNVPDHYAAMHGSPYSYDTFVPVIFYGPGIPARRIVRDVEPASIAPTLAALLGIRAPSAAVAPVLIEVAGAQEPAAR